MVLDCGFDVVDVRERCVTGSVLGSAAGEVPVLAAVATDRALLDESAIDVPFEPTVAAPQAPLQIVGVLAAALSGDSAGVQDGLNAVEQARFDERLMPSFVDLVLVSDLTGVVPVAQHLLDLGV